jgi:hypothetical protein
MSELIDLASLGSQGISLQGASPFDRAGWSVSGAGDINGDGFDDIIVGAPGSDLGGSDAGAAYVIFGGAAGFENIDLENLQPADGFRILGADAFDSLGVSVSSAGDINGDGFADIIIGGSEGDIFYSTIPTAYVILGKASGFSTIDLTNLTGTEGFRIAGSLLYAYTHLSVSSAGDVNGDGFDDIIVGSPYGNGFSGAAYVVFGKASGFGAIDLNNFSSSSGFSILGANGDRAGYSVSNAGDVNGDGFDDVIVGAFLNDAGGQDAGAAYVIFGKASGFTNISLSSLAASAGFMIQGDAASDFAGFSVSNAGDVNGDGFDDVIVGAKLSNSGGTDSGAAYVIFGKASGFTTIDLSSLGTAGFAIQGDAAQNLAGYSVSAAGDVNNDGFDDIIVGAPGAGNGQAYVIYGKATGFGTIDLTNLSPTAGYIISGAAAFDGAGLSVSGAGDVDGDGHDDLIVGAPFADRGGDTAGEAYVISGASGFTFDVANDFNGDGRSDLLWRDASGTMIQWLGQSNDRFAWNDLSIYQMPTDWSVAAVGDFNGDGREDLVWRHSSGSLIEWLGLSDGRFSYNAAASSTLPTNWQLLAAGDFNGDHRDDLLWRNTTGTIAEWLGQANGSFAPNGAVSETISIDYQFAGSGDFNGDGRDDILWRTSTGSTFASFAQANGSFTASASVYAMPSTWLVAATGDFNGDGREDILWREGGGSVIEWLGQSDGTFAYNAAANASIAASQVIWGTGDFNGDGRTDLLLRDASSGTVSEYVAQANGSFMADPASYALPSSWLFQPDPSGSGAWDY